MKITEKSNYRIIVEPKSAMFSWFQISDDDVRRNLIEMEQQIKRHVDNVASVYIDCDTKDICSHCRRVWEVSEDDSDPDFPKGTPVCCDEAVNEYKSQQ